jgi:3-oxoacyl-[acyl-carrier protein] reductase
LEELVKKMSNLRPNEVPNFLIFGASGAIGSACAEKLSSLGNVTSASRILGELEEKIASVPFFAGIVWAQGLNHGDSYSDFDLSDFERVLSANVIFILNTLKILHQGQKIGTDTQLVVLSSIWGEIARPNKLSYGISKAAIGGLIRSLAVDLGPTGVEINSVSPGPIDTPMTVANLKPTELQRVISETPIKRLVSLDEVSSLVCGLATGKFRGVTGQDIIIDGGWSVSKLV